MSVGLLSVGPSKQVSTGNAVARFDYVRQLLLVALCLVWMWPGILNRGPWKPVETTLVQVIQESSQGNHLLKPTLLGKPYQLPPLYLAMAGATARLFDGWLAPHEGMRLINFFWLSLGLALGGLAVGWRYGSRVGWRTVLLITGSPLLLFTAKTVNPDVVLVVVGVAGLLGIHLLDQKKYWAWLILGLTVTLGFWCVGSIAVLYVAALVVMAPMMKLSRSKAHWLGAVAVVLLTGSASYAWWQYHIGSVSTVDLAAPATLLDTVGNLLLVSVWALWPALPFASIAYVRWRYRSMPDTQILLGLLGLLAGSLAIIMGGEVRDTALLVLLPATAVMAAPNITKLTSEVNKSLDWFAVLVLGVGMIGFFWIAWLAFQLGQPASLLAWLNEQQITQAVSGWPIVVALLASLGGLALMLRIGRSQERVILNWMMGLTVSWLVFCILWLPGVDQAKSYAGVAQVIQQELTRRQVDCLDGRRVNPTVIAQLVYYGNTQLLYPESCKWVLTNSEYRTGTVILQAGRLRSSPKDELTIYAIP